MMRRTLRRLIMLTLVLALVLVVFGVSSGVVQAAGYITITPASGPSGTPVTVYGYGFTSGESANITFDGTTVASGISVGSGTWSYTITIPTAATGSHTIGAVGSISGSVTGVTFTVMSSTITLSKTSGSPGTSVTVTGSGFRASDTVAVTFDGTTVKSGIPADSLGNWSTTITIPAATAGSHIIGASGSTTGSVSGVSFTVLGGALTLSRTSGPPGTSITISGTGFGASETGIAVTFDGTVVTSGITANGVGAWSGTFTVPASVAGPHTIGAYGSSTSADSITGVTFTVSPGLAINRTSGSPGSSVTITGSGFGASETGITVTFDGTTVTSGISASSLGNWNTTITIPAATAGSHTIGASGSITSAGSVTGISFMVSPALTLSRTSGPPSSSVTVTGSGFSASETDITVTFDGTPVTSAISASPSGSWSGTFTVPASAAGSHSIKAYGSVTSASSVGGISFKITPTISISPAYGYVGATVKITGFGFAASSSLTFTYDDKDIPAEGITTDATGSFVKSFTVPKSEAGNHTISVADWQNNNAKASFTMDSTPPPVPGLLSPGDGARAGIVGGVTPTFKWSSVTDPSGVTYTLQVDISPDFSQPILEKTGITGNRYTLTAAEALPRGEYYWRVKAIDGASNESAWSQPWLLKAGLMELWTLVLIIALAAVAVGVLVYFALIRPRARRREAIAVPTAEMPQVVTGQWRTIESEEATRERQLPYRLALPGPVKGAKTLSTEDQARLKVVTDFAQSLPLVEPSYTVDWLVDLIESGTGIQMSTPVYEQLFKGELQVRYEPPWVRHPAYQDLTSLLRGQSVLQELNTFIDGVDHCAAEVISLLQQMYRDAITEVPPDFLERGGWGFISAVYADAMSWFIGKSLRDPSERDYIIRPRGGPEEEGEERWLCGEETTSFAGQLLLAPNEKDALKFQALHLRLRRTWRNNSQARQIAAILTQLEIQRSRLLNVFRQFGQIK
jgi:hypothetical protein